LARIMHIVALDFTTTGYCVIMKKYVVMGFLITATTDA
jgi:hypothetical protein